MVYYVMPEAIPFTPLHAQAYAPYSTIGEAIDAAKQRYDEGYGHQVIWNVASVFTTQMMNEILEKMKNGG